MLVIQQRVFFLPEEPKEKQLHATSKLHEV